MASRRVQRGSLSAWLMVRPCMVGVHGIRVHRANGAACRLVGYCSESRGERLVELIWNTQAGNMGKLEVLSCAHCHSNPLLSKGVGEGGEFGPNAMLSSPKPYNPFPAPCRPKQNKIQSIHSNALVLPKPRASSQQLASWQGCATHFHRQPVLAGGMYAAVQPLATAA